MKMRTLLKQTAPLHQAIENRNLPEVRRLIAAGEDPQEVSFLHQYRPGQGTFIKKATPLETVLDTFRQFHSNEEPTEMLALLVKAGARARPQTKVFFHDLAPWDTLNQNVFLIMDEAGLDWMSPISSQINYSLIERWSLPWRERGFDLSSLRGVPAVQEKQAVDTTDPSSATQELLRQRRSRRP